MEPAQWMRSPPAWQEAFAASVPDGPTWLVQFEHVGHGAVFLTPTAEGGSCAVSIALSFLSSPTGAPEIGCADTLAPLDLAVSHGLTQALSAELFGTEDAWGD